MKTLIILLLMVSASAFSSEFSMYRGGYTTHLVGDNDFFNNDNHVVMVSNGQYSFGRMINSYNRTGYMLTRKANVTDIGVVDIDYHIGAATGYQRWHMMLAEYGSDGYDKEIVVPIFVLSAKAEVAHGVSVQANLMNGIALNVGISIDIK